VLLLSEVVARAICQDPRTRKAWGYLASQISLIGVARSAYYPTLDATANAERGRARTNAIGARLFDSDIRSDRTAVSLNLGLTLYDMGLRRAQLQRARQLAAAANAAMDAVCIDVFLEAIQAFHDVRDAESLLAAAARSEEIALRTYEVTTAR